MLHGPASMTRKGTDRLSPVQGQYFPSVGSPERNVTSPGLRLPTLLFFTRHVAELFPTHAGLVSEAE